MKNLCIGLTFKDYSFPYILLAVTLFTNAAYLALFEKQQSPRQLCLELRQKPRHLIVLGIHFSLYVFGIVAIADWTKPAISGCFLFFAFLPSAFYISSVMLSDPDHMMLIYWELFCHLKLIDLQWNFFLSHFVFCHIKQKLSSMCFVCTGSHFL